MKSYRIQLVIALAIIFVNSTECFAVELTFFDKVIGNAIESKRAKDLDNDLLRLLPQGDLHYLKSVKFISSILASDLSYEDEIVSIKDCTVRRVSYDFSGKRSDEKLIKLGFDDFWNRIKILAIYYELFGQFPLDSRIDVTLLKQMILKKIKDVLE